MSDQKRIDLDKIEQAAQQATPGPWEWSWNDDEEPLDLWVVAYDGEETVASGVLDNHCVEHIANCDPQTVLALVRAVRVADKIADRYEGEDGFIHDIIAIIENELLDALAPFRGDK